MSPRRTSHNCQKNDKSFYSSTFRQLLLRSYTQSNIGMYLICTCPLRKVDEAAEASGVKIILPALCSFFDNNLHPWVAHIQRNQVLRMPIQLHYQRLHDHIPLLLWGLSWSTVDRRLQYTLDGTSTWCSGCSVWPIVWSRTWMSCHITSDFINWI